MPTNDPPPFGAQDEYPANPFAAPTAVDEPSGFDPVRSEELTLNPWLAILNRPAETIRAVVNYDPRYQVVTLSVLLGVVSMFGMNEGPESEHFGLAVVLGAALLAGPLVGLAIVWVFSALLTVGARMLGGTGTHAETRAAYVWSIVPGLYAAPITIASAVANSAELHADAGRLLPTIDAVNGIANIVVGIWSFIISLNTVAEVHRFSRWRAFGAMLIPGLIIFAVIAVIAIFVVGGMAGFGGFGP